MSEDVKIINLPRVFDEKGNLSFLEKNKHVPFNIRRVYWIYDVPGGEVRGGHSYKKNRELIIALSGSFDVITFVNGKETKYSLNRSYYGLYIPNGVWRHLENFSTNSLALIISSTDYEAEDYERDLNLYNQKNAK